MDTIIELQIISYVIDTGDTDIITSNSVTYDDFTGGYKDQVKFILEHKEQYGNVPDHATMRRKFPDEYDSTVVNESPLYLGEQLVQRVIYKRVADSIITNQGKLTSGNPEDLQLAAREIVEGINSAISGVGARDIGTNIVKDISRFDDYIESLEGGGQEIIDLQMPGLGPALGGIMPDDLITIFARSSHGKSYLMALIAEVLHSQGFNILFYAGEMETNQVAYRFDTIRTGFSNVGLTFGRPVVDREGNTVDKTTYQNYLKDLQRNDNFFTIVRPSDFGGKMPTTVEIEEVVKKTQPDFIFIDQLSLMSDWKRARDRTEQYDNIIKELRLIASNYAPVFLAHQANREATEKNADGSNKVPEAHQLSYSDSVLHYSTRVIGVALNSTEGSTTSIMSLGIQKNRFNRNESFDMVVDLDKGVFEVHEIPEVEEGEPVDVFAQFQADTASMPTQSVNYDIGNVDF